MNTSELEQEQQQEQHNKKSGGLTFSAALKWISWLFLGLCLLIIVIVLFIGSNLGLKTLSHFANNIDGINIVEVKGSVYSDIQISALSIDKSLGIGLEAKNAKVDISISCLMDFAVCLKQLHVDELSVLLPLTEKDPDETSSKDYIASPLPIALDKISVNTFVLSQEASAQGPRSDSSSHTSNHAPNYAPNYASSDATNQSTSDTSNGFSPNEPDLPFIHKLLTFDDLLIEDVTFNRKLAIKRITLVQLYLLDTNTAQKHTAADESKDTAFELAQLRALLAQAPKIALPDVFIPINAELNLLAIQSLCWLVAEAPEAQNCISLSQAQINLHQQALQSKIELKADDLLAHHGVAAQDITLNTRLHFADNWKHDLSLALLQAPPNLPLENSLLLTLKGTVNNTQLQLAAIEQGSRGEVLNLEISPDLSNEQLPLDVRATFNGIDKLASYLLAQSAIPDISGVFNVSGDWSEYELGSQVVFKNKGLNDKGLSQVELSASLSPKNQLVELKHLKSSGEIGVANISGKSQLMNAADFDNALIVDSNLQLDINNMDLGIFNTESGSNLSTDLVGAFSLNHVFHDDWMRGNIQCKGLGGRVADYDLNLKCDLKISKEGNIDIRELALIQGENKLSLEGEIDLPSSDYLDLSAQELLQGIANMSLQSDIKDASSLYSELGGALFVDGRINGRLEQPVISLNSSAANLSYGEIKLQQGNVDLSLDAGQNYAVNVDSLLNQLMVNDMVIDESTLSISGDKSNHSVVVSAQLENYAFENSVEGGFASESNFTQWKGLLTSLNIALPFDALRLAAPAEMSFDASTKSFNAADHCYLGGKGYVGKGSAGKGNSSKDSTGEVNAGKTDGDGENHHNEVLCVSELQFIDGTGGLEARVNYDIAKAGKHFSPETILPASSLPLRSHISAQFSEADGLQATAFNNLIDGVLELDSQLVELSAIVANLTLNKDTLSSAIFAGTPSAGTLGVVSNITLQPDNRQHDGKLAVTNFDLGILKRFIPSIEEIAGVVNADIGFTGALEKPQLDGTLSVKSGEVFVNAYSYPLTAFNHDMRFEGQGASMQGGFNLGEGTAQYEAQLTLFDTFLIDGTLQGSDMQFALDTIKATVSPDVAFAISQQDIRVTGGIAIPNAQITVNEIPESALTPSSDVLIVGQEPAPPPLPMGIDIDLDIQIDEAKRKFVTVDALDLKASLSGELNLQVEQKRRADGESFQAMRTSLNGQMNILDGSYEAYGQNLLVRAGRIFFNGEPSLPQFDISAIRNPLNTQGDVVAGIRVSGNPVVPRVELFSEPPLTQASQLSYLLQGKDLNSEGESTSRETLLLNALIGFGVTNSGNSVGRLGNALGFDSLNIQTAGTGDNSQVQITGRIAEDIQITYGIGVRDQASEIILKYQLMPQLFIEAKNAADSTVDLFYQVTRGANK